MANLKRAMTPERLKKRRNNLFLPKIVTYLQHLSIFAHIAAMSRPGFQDAVVQDRDFKKRVSRYSPLSNRNNLKSSGFVIFIKCWASTLCATYVLRSSITTMRSAFLSKLFCSPTTITLTSLNFKLSTSQN